MKLLALGVLTAALTGATGFVGKTLYEHKAPTHESTYFLLDSAIRLNSDHTDLIEKLLNAREGDTITIRVAGFGGVVNTVQNIIQAMKVSKATVVVDLVAGAYSAHAILSCAADKILAHDGSFLMFHTVQSRRGPILKEDMDPGILIQVNQLLYKNCSHILTEDEMDNITEQDYEYYVEFRAEGLIKHIKKPKTGGVD